MPAAVAVSRQTNTPDVIAMSLAALQMADGVRPLYPMTGKCLEEYMAIRNDDPEEQYSTDEFVKSLQTIRGHVDEYWGMFEPEANVWDREKRAEWVLLRYLSLA
jgi:hypothetical protein